MSGFSCNRVSFLLSSSYSVVVWFQHENNVGNTLRFPLLLSNAYLKARTFQLSVLCQPPGAQEAGSICSARTADPKWPIFGHVIPYHENHTQYIIRREFVLRERQSLLGIGVCLNCVVRCFFLLSFISLSHSLLSIAVVTVIGFINFFFFFFLIIAAIKLFLS